MAEIIGRVGWRNYVSPISPLWNNLVAYYSGDSTANDSKGTYNGTLVNGATYAVSKINNGFSFDGINDYVSISPTFGSTFSNNTSPHTYSAWIYPTNVTDNYNWIVQNGSNSKGTSMIINLDRLGFFFDGGNGLVTTGSVITVNAWNNVVCAYNGAGQVKFYVNGNLVGTSTASWTDAGGATGTYIGAYVGAAYYFNGKIDEVGAWSRALTAAEVTELYNAGAGKQYVAPAPTSIITTGLVLNLDASNALSYAGTGTTWTDLSGSGNNCTLLNGAAYSSTNGGTMVLDGINDYVKINNVAGLDLGNEYTFSIWVKFNSYNTVLVGSEDWGSTYLMYIANSSTIYTNGEGGGTSFSGANLTTNQWLCLTVVRSVTSNTLYKNGVYIAVSSRSIKSSIVKGIGAYSNGSFPLNGNISSVNAYNRALSESEVLQNFNATKTRFGL